MLLYLIIGICLGAVAVDFAMQNTASVTVALFPWQFTAPLSLVLLGAVALGLLIAALALVPGAIGEALENFARRRAERKAQLRTTSYEAPVDQRIAA